MSSVGRSTKPGLILALVCGAQFMVILDLAIVNVALPSMQVDLGVSQSDLQWVVVSYGLTLGGFLLLGGRMADLLGRRNVLVAGLLVFAAASLGGGVSRSLAPLIAFRALQGLGAAMASPAALSIVTSTFREGPPRNKALGIFGAVGGCAASIGVIAGGVLTAGPGWEWVFLINVPVGIGFVLLVVAFVPSAPPLPQRSMDLLGAVTVTAGLMAIVYAISKSVDYGWTSPATVASFGGGVVLLAVFLVAEGRTVAPLMPLSMFKRRTLTAANVVSLLLWGAFFATIFQGTLFMQQVLDYSAVDTGVAWLAATGSSLVFAAGVAPRVVGRLGPGLTLTIGQGATAAGLLYLTRIPADAAYWADIFPAFLGLGVGTGLSAMAVQVAAFSGVEESVSGLAGGMVETAREVGGALGVAAVATAAISRTEDVLAAVGTSPAAQAIALTEGYQRASLVAAGISIAAGLAALVLLRRAERAAVHVQVGMEPELAPEPVPAEV